MMKNQKFNILFLKFPLESSRGGGEVHTIMLAQEMKRQGAEVFLASSCKVLLAEFKKHELPFRKTWGGIEPVSKFGILLFFFLWPFVLVQMIRLLRLYKKKHRVNIVYCMSLTEKILATLPAKFMGVQVVWVEHVSISRWLTLNPCRFLYTWISDFAEIVAVSQSLKQELERIGVSSSRVHVLYNGIDTETFKSGQQVVLRGVDMAKLKDRKIVGTVARLHKEKGLEYFLQAAAIILDREPQVYFMIIGAGEEYPRLLKLAKELNIAESIFFLGYREDVRPFLELMDVFVLSSIGRESFGMSIAEAMSMKKPIVASDIGGVHELVEQGKSGFLVEEKNPKALALKTLELLGNSELARRFGERGRQIIEERFTLAATVKQFEAFFKRLLHQAPFRAVFMKFPYASVFGGGELHTIQLADGLIERGADVYLISSCRILLDEFKRRGFFYKKAWGGIEAVSKFAIVLFPFLSLFILIRLFLALLWYRLFHKTDVLYCMSLNEKLLLALPARLLGMRVFWVEHLLIERWLIQNPYRFLYVWMSRFVTIITVSDAVKQQLLILGVYERNTRVVHNGVDAGEFSRMQVPEKIGQLTADEVKNSYYPVIGTGSRLAKEKGLEYLLQAAAVVLAKMPKALVVIAGQGVQRAFLESEAKRLGIAERVIFAGFFEHAQAIGLWSLFDIFALTPVSGESFGIAVAEAMMLEKPVVATNIGGISEVVQDRETGLIVRSKDVEGIANAILRLAAYQDEAKEMGRKGKLRVLELFTLDRMVDQIYTLFISRSVL